jgi:hypothetical protein
MHTVSFAQWTIVAESDNVRFEVHLISKSEIHSTNFSADLLYQITFKSVKWRERLNMRTDRPTRLPKFCVPFSDCVRAMHNKGK